jgi:hypothetical protein
MFERFFFSADLGDGAGGDAGGAPAAESAAGGVAGGDPGGGAEATPFDYEGFAKNYGGPEGLQRAVQFASDIQNRAHYNPQFKETLERALRGEFGPQAQADAQRQNAAPGGAPQQPAAQGGGYLQYEPATRVQMETFHREMQRAKESGDPQMIQDVFNDPANAQAKEAYLKHQQEMNNSYWNPREHFSKLWQDPEMQQMRQQELQQAIQQAVEPVQTELAMYQKMNFYERNQQAIDALPQHIKEAFGRGVFGEFETAKGWISAAQAAMAEAKKFAAQPQQPPADAPVAGNETGGRERANYRAPTNGVKSKEELFGKDRSGYSKHAEAMRKAREKDAARTNS